MCEILRKDVEFECSKEYKQAFDQLNELLIMASILRTISIIWELAMTIFVNL